MIVVIYSYINRDLCNIITTTIINDIWLVLILSEEKAHIIRRPHPSHHWSSLFNHYSPSSLLFLPIISCYHPPHPWPSFTVISCHHSSSNRNEWESGRTCNNNSSRGMNERVAVPVTTIAAVYNSRRQKKVAPTIPSSLVTAITHHHQTTISRHNNNSTGCFFAKIITTLAFASLPFCAHNNSSSTVRSIASSHHGNAYQQTQRETATNTIGVFYPNNEKVKIVMNKLVE